MVFNTAMNSRQKLHAAFIKSSMEVVDESRRAMGYKKPVVTYESIKGVPEWATNSNRVDHTKPEESIGGATDSIWRGRTVTGTGKGPVIGEEKGSGFQ